MFYDIKPLLLYLKLQRVTVQGQKPFMKAERGGFCSKDTRMKLTAVNCKRAKLFGGRLTLSIIHSTTMGSSKSVFGTS